MARKGHIVVVEDEAAIRTVIRASLEKAGYLVDEVERGDDVITEERLQRADCYVLDVMLPGRSGLDVCRELREVDPSVPILILSARVEEFDRILGLEQGADDYLTKPFSPRELVLRVESLLRRNQPLAPALPRVGDLEIDPLRRIAHRGEREVHLTRVEFDLLLMLARAPGRVFSRQELMDGLWDGHFVGDLRTVDVHVRHLRQKLGDDPTNPQLLHTVRGVGYALDAERA